MDAPVTVKYFPKIVGTEALGMAVEAWHYLITHNFISDRAIAVMWDHKAVVAFVGDEGAPQALAGVITFQDVEWAEHFNICLGYVRPFFRMQGIHTAMFNKVVDQARVAGRTLITSGHHVHNKASRAMMESQGRIPHSMTWDYEV